MLQIKEIIGTSVRIIMGMYGKNESHCLSNMFEVANNQTKSRGIIEAIVEIEVVVINNFFDIITN